MQFHVERIENQFGRKKFSHDINIFHRQKQCDVGGGGGGELLIYTLGKSNLGKLLGMKCDFPE